MRFLSDGVGKRRRPPILLILLLSRTRTSITATMQKSKPRSGKKRKRPGNTPSDLKKAPKTSNEDLVFDLASLVGMAQNADTESIQRNSSSSSSSSTSTTSGMSNEGAPFTITSGSPLVDSSSTFARKHRKKDKKDRKKDKKKERKNKKQCNEPTVTTGTQQQQPSEQGESEALDEDGNNPVAFGSRSKPTKLRYRDILQTATTSMRANVVRRAAEPVVSKPSQHLFEDISSSSSSSSSSPANMTSSTKSLSTTTISTNNPWEELGLDVRLCRHVQGNGRSVLKNGQEGKKGKSGGNGFGLALAIPTRVQKMAIPHILKGSDVVVRSETGSGKTVTYLLPIVQMLASINTPRRVQRSDGTMAIILAPTRELALQVHEWTTRVLKPYPWLVTGSITGGERAKSEKARLRKGLVVLTCTPGRLLYHLQNTKSFSTTQLKWMVLDEADRLMDLGFQKQLAQIFEELSSRHREIVSSMSSNFPWQTMLISATLSDSVRELVGKALRSPVYVNADAQSSSASDGSGTMDGQIPQQLSQHVALVDSPHRLVSLISFLRQQIVAATAAIAAAAAAVEKTTEAAKAAEAVAKKNDKIAATATTSTPSGCRIVIFLATCASVDFHHALLDALANCGGGSSGVATGLTDVASLAAVFRGRLYRLHGEVSQVERSKVSRCWNGAFVVLLVVVNGSG